MQDRHEASNAPSQLEQQVHLCHHQDHTQSYESHITKIISTHPHTSQQPYKKAHYSWLLSLQAAAAAEGGLNKQWGGGGGGASADSLAARGSGGELIHLALPYEALPRHRPHRTGAASPCGADSGASCTPGAGAGTPATPLAPALSATLLLLLHESPAKTGHPALCDGLAALTRLRSISSRGNSPGRGARVGRGTVRRIVLGEM